MSRLSLHGFWWRYAAMGGDHTPEELLAYLGGHLEWDAGEHNVAAQALNEYCTEAGFGHPVAYADEL